MAMLPYASRVAWAPGGTTHVASYSSTIAGPWMPAKTRVMKYWDRGIPTPNAARKRQDPARPRASSPTTANEAAAAPPAKAGADDKQESITNTQHAGVDEGGIVKLHGDQLVVLVHAHRDKNPIDVTAQYLASRLIQWTGNENAVKDGLRKVNLLGIKLAEALGSAVGSKALEKGTKNLIGVADRDVFFRFREASHLSEKEVKARIEKLQKEARALLRARGRSPPDRS